MQNYLLQSVHCSTCTHDLIQYNTSNHKYTKQKPNNTVVIVWRKSTEQTMPRVNRNDKAVGFAWRSRPLKAYFSPSILQLAGRQADKDTLPQCENILT